MEATTFNVTTDRYIFEDTEIEICTNFSRQEVPITTEPCNFDVLCPVRYFPSNFGPVSEHKAMKLKNHSLFYNTLV